MAISHLFPEEGPTLNLNFAGSRTLDPRITFSRSSVGTYMDANGLIVTAAADQPRFDHRYVNGEIESLGLLIEEQRTNLMPRSQDFSASPGGWTLSTGGSRTQNLIGPDGVTNSAWTITDSNTTGDLAQFYKQISISASSSTKYCISCFMKDVDNAGITPDLYAFFSGNSTKGSYVRYTFSTDSFTAHAADGGGIQPSVYGSIPYPNGWVRLYFVVDDSNNGSNTTLQFRIYPNTRGANATGSMGFFGVQIEIGSFPTSYIPTEGSTKTRTKDVPQMVGTNLTDWFSSTEGTFIINHRWNTLDTFVDSLFAVSTDGGGSGINLYDVTSAAYGAGLEYPGTNNFVKILSPGYYKYGLTYNTTSRATVVNGGGVVEDNNAFTSLNTVNRFSIGMDRGNNWQGSKTIAQLTYYPTRLPNSQLQALTR